jgi:hypothetical protein
MLRVGSCACHQRPSCLEDPGLGSNLSFDLASIEEGEGTSATTDFAALLGTLKGRTYDYTKPENSPVPLP